MVDFEAISISIPEVSSTAASIRSSNQKIKANLDEIRNQMNLLSQSWNSPAGEDIRTRFNALQKTFQDHYEKINNYATFLDQTVDAYEQNEATVGKNPDSFT